MATIREEEMNEFFRKVFVDGVLPDKPIIYHIFSGPERGDFHDHPFSIKITVLQGWYDEEIRFVYDTDEVLNVRHHEGETFVIEAEHIHRIVDMSPEGCVTQVSYGPWKQEPGFWQFRDNDEVWQRRWNGDWIRYR